MTIVSLKEENSSEITVPEQQSALVTKLQRQISQQRDDIRGRNAVLEERSQEIDAVRFSNNCRIFRPSLHLAYIVWHLQ